MPLPCFEHIKMEWKVGLIFHPIYICLVLTQFVRPNVSSIALFGWTTNTNIGINYFYWRSFGNHFRHCEQLHLNDKVECPICVFCRWKQPGGIKVEKKPHELSMLRGSGGAPHAWEARFIVIHYRLHQTRASQRPAAVISVVNMIALLSNVASAPAALLLRSLSNFRAIGFFITINQYIAAAILPRRHS